MTTYTNIIAKFAKKKIFVVGDLILDEYIQGSVSRISPEAPVPVVHQQETFYTPGGAANVAHNLSSLGATVMQVGRIGDDRDGQILVRVLKQKKINTKGIFVDQRLPTITKTRVMAQHQQIVRIDKEKIGVAGQKTVTQKIVNFIKRNLKAFDAVIISDYGKGLITPELVRFIVDLAIKHKKIISVDPKVEHFSYYNNVTAITPNLSEAENAIRNIKVTSRSSKLDVYTEKLKTDAQINLAGKELLKCLDLESLLITLGERGMRLFEKGKSPVSIKTQVREVFDVSGAGDTVISVFTLAMTAGATKSEAAHLANYGAGIVVAKMGAVAPTKQELLEAIGCK